MRLVKVTNGVGPEQQLRPNASPAAAPSQGALPGYGSHAQVRPAAAVAATARQPGRHIHGPAQRPVGLPADRRPTTPPTTHHQPRHRRAGRRGEVSTAQAPNRVAEQGKRRLTVKSAASDGARNGARNAASNGAGNGARAVKSTIMSAGKSERQASRIVGRSGNSGRRLQPTKESHWQSRSRPAIAGPAPRRSAPRSKPPKSPRLRGSSTRLSPSCLGARGCPLPPAAGSACKCLLHAPGRTASMRR